MHVQDVLPLLGCAIPKSLLHPLRSPGPFGRILKGPLLHPHCGQVRHPLSVTSVLYQPPHKLQA